MGARQDGLNTAPAPLHQMQENGISPSILQRYCIKYISGEMHQELRKWYCTKYIATKLHQLYCNHIAPSVDKMCTGLQLNLFPCLGLFQPEGNDEMSNKGFNQNMTNLPNYSSTQLRNPEGERPRSNSTTLQSEIRGNFELVRYNVTGFIVFACDWFSL